MRRYIDADKLKDNFCGACATPKRYQRTFEECQNHRDTYGNRCFKMRLIDTTPTADVEEVRHGEWQYEQLDEYKFYKVTCPYCDAYYMGNYDAYNEPDDFNYCPNCGAKMDGDRREG